jgi:hypothetical protein
MSWRQRRATLYLEPWTLYLFLIILLRYPLFSMIITLLFARLNNSRPTPVNAHVNPWLIIFNVFVDVRVGPWLNKKLSTFHLR